MPGAKIVPILLTVGAMVLVACSDNKGPDFAVEMRAGSVSRQAVDQALAAFRQSCAPLGQKYWGDVVAAKAVVGNGYADYRLANGWKTEIEIAITIKDKPSTIPAEHRAGGQTLWYYAGGGSAPGFFAKKSASASLCGLTPSPTGADVFKAVPELAVIGTP